MKEMKNRTAEYNRIGQLPIDATFFFLHACVSHPIPTDLVFVGSFLFFSSSFFFFGGRPPLSAATGVRLSGWTADVRVYETRDSSWTTKRMPNSRQASGGHFRPRALGQPSR